jgi:hypothetical protein
MRIIAYDNSRVTMLFPLEEVSPLGGASGPAIFDAIGKRYSFAKRPNLSAPRDELEKTGYKFELGSIITSEKEITIGELAIFGDGIVVGAVTTDDAEVLIDNLIEYIKSEHKFRDFNTLPIRRFVSQIVVEFERPLSSLMDAYNTIAAAISGKLEAVYETKIPLGLGKIEVQFDKLLEQSSLIVPNFTIERRVGIPFNKERYYCSAPLRTRDHLEVLGQIESLLH